MDSILNSIKKLLGIPNEETHFDSDIIMHINTVFSILCQIGIGPTTSFSIADENAVWDDFIEDYPNFNDVKTYMYLKVKLFFDPPLNSSGLSAIEGQISELEFRLSVDAVAKSLEVVNDDEII